MSFLDPIQIFLVLTDLCDAETCRDCTHKCSDKFLPVRTNKYKVFIDNHVNEVMRKEDIHEWREFYIELLNVYNPKCDKDTIRELIIENLRKFKVFYQSVLNLDTKKAAERDGVYDGVIILDHEIIEKYETPEYKRVREKVEDIKGLHRNLGFGIGIMVYPEKYRDPYDSYIQRLKNGKNRELYYNFRIAYHVSDLLTLRKTLIKYAFYKAQHKGFGKLPQLFYG